MRGQVLDMTVQRNAPRFCTWSICSATEAGGVAVVYISTGDVNTDNFTGLCRDGLSRILRT